MESLSAIGARVRTLRRRRGLTQEELAGRIGRSVETLSVLERGRATPTLPVLGRLSEALAVPLRDFFDPASGAGGPGPGAAGLGASGPETTSPQAAKQAALITALLDCARNLPPPELTLANDILERIAAYHRDRPPSGAAGQGETAPGEAKASERKAALSNRELDPARETLAMLLRLYNNDRPAITATLKRRQRFLDDLGETEDAAFLARLLKLLWAR